MLSWSQVRLQSDSRCREEAFLKYIGIEVGRGKPEQEIALPGDDTQKQQRAH